MAQTGSMFAVFKKLNSLVKTHMDSKRKDAKLCSKQIESKTKQKQLWSQSKITIKGKLVRNYKEGHYIYL
jgi:hypothetical protein